MASTKLNIFQRGILQKAVTVFAYLGSIAIGAFILDLAEKRLFVTTAKQAEQRGIITPEGFSGLKLLIESREPTTIFAVILIGLFCVVAGCLCPLIENIYAPGNIFRDFISPLSRWKCSVQSVFPEPRILACSFSRRSQKNWA